MNPTGLGPRPGASERRGPLTRLRERLGYPTGKAAGEASPPSNTLTGPTAPGRPACARIVVLPGYRRPPRWGRRFPMTPRTGTRRLFARTPRTIRQGPARFRPRLEPLEHRCLPAVTLLPQLRVNTGHLDGNQDEATIAVDPTNLNRLFVAANNTPMSASSSSDGGKTWTSRTFGTGTGLGGDGLPTSFCDGQAVFDQFGNLFLTYIGRVTVNGITQNTVELLVSADGGRTFTALPRVDGPGNVDQPSLAVGPGNAPGVGSVWLSWRNANFNISVRGAPVRGLGAVGTF